MFSLQKLILLSSFFCFSAVADPSFVSATQMDTMINYLQQAPATLSGQISAGRTALLSDTRFLGVKVGVRLNANFPISFSLTENQLVLSSRAGVPGALTLMIGGIPIKINSVTYSENGDFSSDITTPLGTLRNEIQGQINSTLNKMFKEKMRTAFNELRTIRSERTISDVQSSIHTIMNILTSPTSGQPVNPELANLPLSGDINLKIHPPTDRTLHVGSLDMEVAGGDEVTAGVSFNNRNNLFNVTRMEMSSRQGIIFHPNNVSRNDLMSARVTRIVIDENGVTPTFLSGAEGALAGLGLVIQTFIPYQGATNLIECDDMRIAALQNWLNCQLNGQLIPIVRENIAKLREARISPEIISALLVPSLSPENCNLARPLR